MHYWYISGFKNDYFNVRDSISWQIKKIKSWGASPDQICLDLFHKSHFERSGLFYLINYVAKPDDTITAVYAHNFYSSIREFCSLIEIAKDKEIILTARDLDLDARDNIDDVCDIKMLCHTETLNLKRQLLSNKTLKRNAYLMHLNSGGHNTRVITRQYWQAYSYLKNHTYSETAAKYRLSKSTLYRIKKQIENK